MGYQNYFNLATCKKKIALWVKAPQIQWNYLHRIGSMLFDYVVDEGYSVPPNYQNYHTNAERKH